MNDIKKWYGHYRGKVVDNNDPLVRGLVKVFVPGVYPDTFKNDPESLPWAEPTAGLFGGNGVATIGRNSETGMSSTLRVNADVWVFFEQGDHNYPIISHAIQSGTGWMAEHRNQHVIRTDNFNLIIDEDIKSDDLNFDKFLTDNSTTEYKPENKVGVKKTFGEYSSQEYQSNNTNIKKPLIPKSISGIQYKSGNIIPAKDFNKPTLKIRLHLDVSGNVNVSIDGDLNLKINGNVYEEHNGDKFITHNGNRFETHNGNIYKNITGNIIESHTGNIQSHIIGNKLTNHIGNENIEIEGNRSAIISNNLQETIGYDILQTNTRMKIVTALETNTISMARITNITGTDILTVSGITTTTAGTIAITSSTSINVIATVDITANASNISLNG